jgi:hypothetical protein
MKITVEGFKDNTYKEKVTEIVTNVMAFSANADDGFLNVSFYDDKTNSMKQRNFTSLQWTTLKVEP